MTVSTIASELMSLATKLSLIADFHKPKNSVKILDCCVRGHNKHSKFQLMFGWHLLNCWICCKATEVTNLVDGMDFWYYGTFIDCDVDHSWCFSLTFCFLSTVSVLQDNPRQFHQFVHFADNCKVSDESLTGQQIFLEDSIESCL